MSLKLAPIIELLSQKIHVELCDSCHDICGGEKKKTYKINYLFHFIKTTLGAGRISTGLIRCQKVKSLLLFQSESWFFFWEGFSFLKNPQTAVL